MNALTRTLILNAQPSTLLMGTGSVLAGLTASCLRGGFSIFSAVLTLLFVLFMQTAANLRYGYSDLAYMMGENFSMTADAGNGNTTFLQSGAHMRLLKVMSNGFMLLTVTVAIPLLEFIGWIGLLYAAVVVVITFFTYSGPRPLIRTSWGLLSTFLLFGPVGVSGTALIQDPGQFVRFPIFVCSIISGLMAVNAHLAIGYTHYREDLMNNKTTLTVNIGRRWTRVLYLCDSMLVCASIISGPYVMDFPLPWLGIPVAGCQILSALAVYFRMRLRPSHNSRRIRQVTAAQYIVTIVLMLAIVIISTDARYKVLHFVA